MSYGGQVVACAPRNDNERLYVFPSPETCSAAFRKQSRHRQSPPSTGIGKRNDSSAHQQGPDRLQVNSVPQPEQARRREAGMGVSNRFVMNRTESWPCFHVGFMSNGSMIVQAKIAWDHPRKA
jgi:hypothetical protein